MRRQAIVAVLLALLLSALAIGCSNTSGNEAEPGGGREPAVTSPDEGPAEEEPADTATLIEERCIGCHSLDRIKSAEHDEATWGSTVARMRQAGAELTDEEAAQITEFLAGGGGSEL